MGASECPLWTWKSIRLRVAMLLALALTIEGLMRSSLNMAYVCMVAESHLEPTRPLQVHDDTHCPVLAFGNATKHTYRGTLEWTSSQRAYLFPVFYVGGLAASVTYGFLERKMGSSRAVLYGAIVNVAGTLLTPVTSIYFGPLALAALRFIMGFGQGVLWPSMSVLIAKWFPVVEKSTALAIATTGNQLSIVLSNALTAQFCEMDLLDGWPLAFYAYGAAGAVLCVMWYIVVSDSPAESRAIKSEEKLLLCGDATKLEKGEKRRKAPPAPWSSVLSSLVVWSISGSSFCHNFVVVGFSSYLPIYYKSVHNMSLFSNGILSTIPFLAQFISKVIFAGLADTAKKRKWMSVTAITKICNTTASVGIACGLLVMAVCDCSSRWIAVVAASTAMAFISGYVPGYNTSVVCVAPSQTAAVAGVSRFWAQLGMSISPTLIGVIVTTGRVEEWRCIFVIMAILCITTGIFFQFCGSASIQHWNSSVEAPLAGKGEDVLVHTHVPSLSPKDAATDSITDDKALLS